MTDCVACIECDAKETVEGDARRSQVAERVEWAGSDEPARSR